MTEKPDFEALRKQRDAEISKMIPSCAEAVHVNYGGGTARCYCACATGGPCEHEFEGWRDFEDGRGGETFCKRCGMGAMSHSMWLD